ncbi:hypothetical protein ES332_D02G197300v1 [Gossypium tomentosum]|uniref:RRM domain-containing protein n=1 Tax=Gossypium tomentosum TaxID=34277 RepID=A0A5D2LZG5_GOSTO|nr:hypothetical protein ES332_D02G197300v1 [Gossypium tomentosum]
MGETGTVRFPGNLDPSAQEFWPAQNVVCQPQFPLYRPPQLYYPYAASPTVPFCSGGVPQFHAALPLHAPVAVPAPTPFVTTASMVVAPQLPLPPPTAAASRALVLTLVPCDVSESKVRKELEVFGEVRGVQMERVREGIVTVHFYDLRYAEKALKEIREQHMQEQARVRDQYTAAATGCEPGVSNACVPLPSARGLIAGSPVWAHFTIPASNAVPEGNNQGTVVVFNLDTAVSISQLKDIFQAYVVKDKVGSSGGPKKTVKKNQSNSSTVAKHNQQLCRGRPWKGRQSKKFDPRFLISEDAMVGSDSKDSRTTVMIKNIPNKYSQKLLLNMLDNHCIHCNEQIAEDDDQPLSSYDFVYLPIDFNNKCNVGYGFVNMTSPQATWRLYKAFHHQHWEVFNSRKICEVTYARVQGLEALKEHFRNSKFPCEMEHYLPVVFSPPRDGKQLTEPLPIVGQKQQSPNSGPSAKDNEEDEDDYDHYDHSGDESCNENPLADDDNTANSAQEENNVNSISHLKYWDSDDTDDQHDEFPQQSL